MNCRCSGAACTVRPVPGEALAMWRTLVERAIEQTSRSLRRSVWMPWAATPSTPRGAYSEKLTATESRAESGLRRHVVQERTCGSDSCFGVRRIALEQCGMLPLTASPTGIQGLAHVRTNSASGLVDRLRESRRREPGQLFHPEITLAQYKYRVK